MMIAAIAARFSSIHASAASTNAMPPYNSRVILKYARESKPFIKFLSMKYRAYYERTAPGFGHQAPSAMFQNWRTSRRDYVMPRQPSKARRAILAHTKRRMLDVAERRRQAHCRRASARRCPAPPPYYRPHRQYAPPKCHRQVKELLKNARKSRILLAQLDSYMPYRPTPAYCLRQVF